MSLPIVLDITKGSDLPRDIAVVKVRCAELGGIITLPHAFCSPQAAYPTKRRAQSLMPARGCFPGRFRGDGSMASCPRRACSERHPNLQRVLTARAASFDLCGSHAASS